MYTLFNLSFCSCAVNMKYTKLKRWAKRVGIFSLLLTVLWLIFAQTSWRQTIEGNYNVQWNYNTVNYSNTKDPNYLNPHSYSIKGLEPIKLTQLFLEYQNNNMYDEACSILVKRKGNIGCNVVDWDQIGDFSREVKKYQNGYEQIITQPLNEGNDYDQTICVKYSYVLKADGNPARIREILSYDWEKRKDWEWELASRVCERKYKEGMGERPCPNPTNNRRCEQVMK